MQLPSTGLISWWCVPSLSEHALFPLCLWCLPLILNLFTISIPLVLNKYRDFPRQDASLRDILSFGCQELNFRIQNLSNPILQDRTYPTLSRAVILRVVDKFFGAVTESLLLYLFFPGGVYASEHILSDSKRIEKAVTLRHLSPYYHHQGSGACSRPKAIRSRTFIMIDYATYNVPDIKMALKRRGLRQSGKKADLVARLIDAVEKETFQFFPKLPPELRRKIWLHALPRRRIVDVKHGFYGCSVSKPSLSTALDFMLICKDACSAASARYRPIPNPQWCRAQVQSEHGEFSIKLNYHDDVFYLSDYAAAIEELDRPVQLLDLKLIKTVAIPIYDFELSLDEYGAFEQLLKLPSLEEVILVQDLRSEPKVSNRPKSLLRQMQEMMAPVGFDPPSWLQSYTTKFDDWFWQPLATAFINMVSEEPKFEALKNVKVCYSEFQAWHMSGLL